MQNRNPLTSKKHMKTPRWFSPNRFFSILRIASGGALLSAAAAMVFIAVRPSSAVTQSALTYDINTLAGKVASVNAAAGLHVRVSGSIEQEASKRLLRPVCSRPADADHAAYVLTSPLDGTTVLAPAVTVQSGYRRGAANETAIAVDPNNPNRIVGGANDYVTPTWECMVMGRYRAAHSGDGSSGTYYSNDGGSSWCCNSNPNSDYTPTTDPSQIGTLIPGVEYLVGGQYDAGGDPSVAFDSQGHVFYAGLGFNRTSPPNTVAVNKGTFDGSGTLTWGAPTFINPDDRALDP